jgi:hypothetical protein
MNCTDYVGTIHYGHLSGIAITRKIIRIIFDLVMQDA